MITLCDSLNIYMTIFTSGFGRHVDIPTLKKQPPLNTKEHITLSVCKYFNIQSAFPSFKLNFAGNLDIFTID